MNEIIFYHVLNETRVKGCSDQMHFRPTDNNIAEHVCNNYTLDDIV